MTWHVCFLSWIENDGNDANDDDDRFRNRADVRSFTETDNPIGDGSKSHICPSQTTAPSPIVFFVCFFFGIKYPILFLFSFWFFFLVVVVVVAAFHLIWAIRCGDFSRGIERIGCLRYVYQGRCKAWWMTRALGKRVTRLTINIRKRREARRRQHPSGH